MPLRREGDVSDYYLGEVRMFGFGWAPRGWLLCDGAIVQILQYQALYSLLFTRYGGDGRITFGIPDLRGRALYGYSTTNSSYKNLGEQAGAETVAITAATMPAHSHDVGGVTTPGAAVNPKGGLLGQAPLGTNVYAPATSLIAINPASLATTGGSEAHGNMQPFLVVNYCIACTGVYPPRQ